jgi:hypothetical protein
MNDSAVEQDFGGIRNAIKLLQSLVEFIIIVMGKGCHPGLDFLCDSEHPALPKVAQLRITHLLQRHYEVPALCISYPVVVCSALVAS